MARPGQTKKCPTCTDVCNNKVVECRVVTGAKSGQDKVGSMYWSHKWGVHNCPCKYFRRVYHNDKLIYVSAAELDMAVEAISKEQREKRQLRASQRRLSFGDAANNELGTVATPAQSQVMVTPPGASRKKSKEAFKLKACESAEKPNGAPPEPNMDLENIDVMSGIIRGLSHQDLQALVMVRAADFYSVKNGEVFNAQHNTFMQKGEGKRSRRDSLTQESRADCGAFSKEAVDVLLSATFDVLFENALCGDFSRVEQYTRAVGLPQAFQYIYEAALGIPAHSARYLLKYGWCFESDSSLSPVSTEYQAASSSSCHPCDVNSEL